MKNTQVIGFAVVIIALLGLIFMTVKQEKAPLNEPKELVTSFNECAEAGYPITTSTPPTCITPLGNSFIYTDITTEDPTTTSTAPIVGRPEPIINPTPDKGTGPIINRDILPISPTGSPLGHTENYTVGSKKFYSEGLAVTLVSITSSLCPPDVACIWAGELTATLSIQGGRSGSSAQTVVLSSVRTPMTTLGGYTFTMHNANETVVGIEVSN